MSIFAEQSMSRHIMYIMISVSLVVVIAAFCFQRKEEALQSRIIFDAGPIFASTTPTIAHKFELHNPLSRALKILGENHSCSCTEVAIANRVVPPGGTALITLKVKVPHGFSRQTIVCNVQLDSATSPSCQLMLKFSSYPQARLVPEILDLGQIKADKTAGPQESRLTLEIYQNPGRSQVKPKQLVTSDELHAELDNKFRSTLLDDGITKHEYDVLITIKNSSLNPGRYRKDVVAVLQNGLSTLGKVIWDQGGIIQCVPNVISLGLIDGNSGTLKRPVKLQLNSSDDIPFRIISVKTNSDQIGILEENASVVYRDRNKSHVITVLFTVISVKSPFESSTITVKTDHPKISEVKIPFSVFFKK